MRSRTALCAAGTVVTCVVLVACSTSSPPATGGGAASGSATPPAPVTVTVTSTAPPTTPAEKPSPAPTSAVGPASWSDVAKAAKRAIVRIDVATCDARWMGTGFVVGDHLVMTANHVAAGASAITLQYAGGVTSARVVGLDPQTDSALLRTDAPITDHALGLTPNLPDLGESVAVLGFPLATYELRFTDGSVSGLHERVHYGNGPDIDAMVTDSAINPGNSGGPVLDGKGKVVGLVSGQLLWVTGDRTAEPAQGQGYVVPSPALASNLERWRSKPDLPLAKCGNTYDPSGATRAIDVTVNPSDPVAQDIARSLVVHGDAINAGNYEAAWQVFSSRMRSKMGNVESWSSGLGSSYWNAITIQRLTGTGDTALVRTVLRTEQSAANGHDGQTCSVWVMDYGMVRSGGGWLIDSAQTPEGPPTAC